MIFHQANKFMTDFFSKKLKLPANKVPYCLGKFGNTSSSSIPLTISSELFEEVKSRIDLDAYFSSRITYSLPKIQLSEVPLKEIGEIKKLALKRFYTPVRIFRIAKTTNSVKELKFYWGKFKKNILKAKFGEAQRGAQA